MCKKVVAIQNLNQAAGGRILEIKTGLCKPCAEIRLGCLSHKRGAGIAVFSPKANAKGVENA